jgi:ABC-type amino acid transport substrate-binding protein
MRLSPRPSAATATLALAALLLLPCTAIASGGDLEEIQKRGVLRHLGIPYAGFVTGGGDGLDVELARLFAQRIGVRYEFVRTDWPTALPDLTGRRVSASVADLGTARPAEIRGDLLATGLTILPWRERVADFSAPVFPTQVWVVARADSSVHPIRPSGDLATDIRNAKALLARRSVLGVASTCLDPSLYQVDATGAKVLLRKIQLDEVAPALINGDGELALLDVADAMIALQKWPGKIKVIGPISPRQEMGVAFRKGSPRLRAAFDEFLAEIRRDGTYRRLVRAYFPEASVYFPDFFASAR